MRPFWVLVLACVQVTLAPVAAHAQSRGAFDLDRGKPDQIILMRPNVAPPDPMPPTRMQRERAGVLLTLDRRGHIRLKRAEQTHRVRVERAPPTSARPLFDAHIRGAASSLVVSVIELPDGALLARRSDERGALARLDRERVRELLQDTPRFHGAFDQLAAPVAPGRIADLPQPYTPGEPTLDARTLSQRLYAGKRTRVRAVTRTLLEERLIVRPPAGYDPARPAGLVVWVDPADRGAPPQVLHAVCDELNMVAIGAADSGNGRPFVDRMQLVLDAAASAQNRYHIDPKRVYLVGFSGGGRISSMMIACFPDLFAGAAPIGGLNHSAPARTSDGKTWPKTYERPRGRRLAQLRQRRVAPITGPADFNYEQMLEYAKGWRRDRVPIEFFDVPGMGHTLPPTEVMREALFWIDEPWRERHAEQLDQARRDLDEILESTTGRELAPTERERVVEIADRVPWTTVAERAIRALDAAP